MTNTPKLNHYNPRFYLRGFSNRDDGQLYQVSIADKKKVLVHPNVSGAENLLYTPLIEGLFKEVDTNSSNTFRKLINNPDDISMEDRESLIECIALASMRVPSSISDIKRIEKNIIPIIIEKTAPNLTDSLIDEIKSKQKIKSKLNNYQIREILSNFSERFNVVPDEQYTLRNMVLMSLKAIDILIEFNWKIYLSSNNFFITSDNPVTIFDKNLKTNILWGFGKQNIEIIFPVSKNVCIIGTHGKKESNFSFQKVDQIFVKKMNFKIYVSSNKFIFVPEINSFIDSLLNIKKEKIYSNITLK